LASDREARFASVVRMGCERELRFAFALGAVAS